MGIERQGTGFKGKTLMLKGGRMRGSGQRGGRGGRGERGGRGRQ